MILRSHSARTLRSGRGRHRPVHRFHRIPQRGPGSSPILKRLSASKCNVRHPTTALALFGLVLMVTLEVKKVRGSILIGVLTTTLIAWMIGLVHWAPSSGGLSSLTETAFKLDIKGALNNGLLEIVFVFFFVDLFDNLGTLVAVTKRAGLLAADHLHSATQSNLCAHRLPPRSSDRLPELHHRHQAMALNPQPALPQGDVPGVTAIVTGHSLSVCHRHAAPFVNIICPKPPLLQRSSSSARSCSHLSLKSAGTSR